MKQEKKITPANEGSELNKQATVKRLGKDAEALARLVDDHKLLVEAIETTPMPYCVYDASDRLIVANSAYQKLHPSLAEVLEKGSDGGTVYYRDVVRQQLSGQYKGADLEREVANRVATQRHCDGVPVEREYPGIGVFDVSKFALPSGGVAGIAFDVTDLKQRETELKIQSQRTESALQKEQVRKNHSRHMSELGEWLQSCKSLDELFRVVRRFVARLFPGTVGELYIYSNSRDVLDGACAWPTEDGMNAHIQPDDCWALRRGRMLRYGTGFADLSCKHVPLEPGEDPDDLRYTCIPIIAHGDTVGLLHIRFLDLSSQPLDDAEYASFTLQCAEQISLAVANIRLRDDLEEQSTRDPLTGLFNRRHFMNRFRKDLVEARTSNTPLSLISMDADKFKTLNDTHGHDAGDFVLQALADCFVENTGEDQTVARVGGEEFCLVAPRHGMEEAVALAERLREAVADLGLKYDGVALTSVSISCGVATADKNASIQGLMRAADAALYEAKDSGRNRVCRADDGG